MLLPLTIFFQLKEAPELDCAQPGHCLALIGPEGHKFASDIQVLRLLRLLSQVLSERLQLALLQAKHSVTPASLRIDGLCLFNSQSLLSSQELLHSF